MCWCSDSSRLGVVFEFSEADAWTVSVCSELTRIGTVGVWIFFDSSQVPLECRKRGADPRYCAAIETVKCPCRDVVRAPDRGGGPMYWAADATW